MTELNTEKTKPSKRAIGKPFRLTVADVFRGGIIHPVSVAGRIDAGSVQVGDVLLDMPTGEKVAVKAIEVDDEPRDWAIAGHNAVLHLGGIEIDHIRSYFTSLVFFIQLFKWVNQTNISIHLDKVTFSAMLV